MKRRGFIRLIGGATAWPLSARAGMLTMAIFIAPCTAQSAARDGAVTTIVLSAQEQHEDKAHQQPKRNATPAPHPAALMLVPLGANAATSQQKLQSGLASVYSGTYSGKRATALQLLELTAAHRTLPFGTLVQVTNPRNGQSVVVRINDRGPFIRGRVIDLSLAAARVLGISGLAPVTLVVLP